MAMTRNSRLARLRGLPGLKPWVGAATMPSFCGLYRESRVERKDVLPPVTRESAVTTISGYAHDLARKTGQRVVFCLDGPLREGDRLPVETVNGEFVDSVNIGRCSGGQPPSDEPWKDGFGFPSRATYELDESLPSGLYCLAGDIPFVHGGQRRASLAVLIPTHTANAFNYTGGKNLYAPSDPGPADTLSFHRPLGPPQIGKARMFAAIQCEGFLTWFARANPYPDDTAYLIDSDLEEPDALDGVEVLIVIGRSEYWTRAMRERFDAHVDRGGRVLLLCSELMYWQVRVDLLRHRMHRFGEQDPHPDPLLRTVRWNDPSLRYPIHPRTGGELHYGGNTATDEGIGWPGMRIASPGSPLLEGAGLATGDVVRLPDATVWDGAPVAEGCGEDETPSVDFGDSPPWRHEVIGYNRVKPSRSNSGDGAPDSPATSLWMAMRRTPESGTVVHCGTFGWCGMGALGGRGPDSELTRAIVLRMLEVLREDAWPFSPGTPT